jgi:MFS family permease
MDVDAKTPLVSVATFADSVRVLGQGRGGKPKDEVLKGAGPGRPCRQARAQGAQDRRLPKPHARGVTATPPPPLWRQREYMLLWSGQVVTTLGAQASGIIYPLLILALTGSPAQASWATALRMLPYLVLSLPVGALIDRWDRRRVMLVCHIGRGLAVASMPLAMALGALTLGHIYAVAVLEGALHVFFNIAETAALPRVVPQGQLPQATAQNQAGFATAGVLGPALGSWLYQVVGAASRSWSTPPAMCWARWPCGAAHLVRAGAARAARAAARRGGRRHALAVEPACGARHGADHLRANFVSAAMPLLLIVRGKELGASEAQIGLVFSLGGVGAIAGRGWLGGWMASRLRFGQAIVLSIGVKALCIPLFLLCPGPLTLGAGVRRWPACSGRCTTWCSSATASR